MATPVPRDAAQGRCWISWSGRAQPGPRANLTVLPGRYAFLWTGTPGELRASPRVLWRARHRFPGRNLDKTGTLIGLFEFAFYTAWRVAVIVHAVWTSDGGAPCPSANKMRVTMKIHAIALAGVAALALATPASAGQGWYLGFGVGESWADGDLQGNGFNVNGAPTSPHGSLDFGRSADVEISAGYKWADSGMWDGGFRLEGEVGLSLLLRPFVERRFSVRPYHRPHRAGFRLHQRDLGLADRSEVGCVVRRRYRHRQRQRQTIHDRDVTPPQNGHTNRLAFNDDQSFTWQLLGGLTYEVDPNVDLQLDYRYQGVGDTSHDTDFQLHRAGRRSRTSTSRRSS